jgi:hypothetical protein
LNNGAKFCQLFGGVVLNIRNALQEVSGTTQAPIDIGVVASKYAMSCFTITFHVTKRSMRTSEGLSSCRAVFFLIKDWPLDMPELCLLPLERDVARETEPSWVVMVRWSGIVPMVDCYVIVPFGTKQGITPTKNTTETSSPCHECRCPEPLAFPWPHARQIIFLISKVCTHPDYCVSSK